MNSSIAIWFVAIGLTLGLVVGLASQAWAQYPPASGSVVLATANTTPGLGEEVAISATIQDQHGVVAAGVVCTFGITRQAGDDAHVDAGPFTTDAAGSVSTTLYTGSVAGTIVVETTCGELSAQVSVAAGAEAPALPPAALPETGASAEAGGAGWAFWALIGAGAVVGLGGLTLAWRRAKA